MRTHHSTIGKRMRLRESGFTLIELMIASTIGLIIVAALTYVLFNNMQSRNELEKNNYQIENGRYALAALTEEIQLAGFYGEYVPSITGLITPDPCTNILNAMGFADANQGWNNPGTIKVPVGLYGYSNGSGISTNCNTLLANRAANTDVLVIRRASTTQIEIDTNADHVADANVTMEDGSTATYASLGNAHYLQGSNCNDPAFPAEAGFVMDHDPTKFTLHKVKEGGSPISCMNGTLNSVRKYLVHIFYIRTCSNCAGAGDGIPTLVMVDLAPDSTVCAANATSACGIFTPRPIAEGIERMNFEFGIDTDNDGVPDNYSAAPAAADWEKIVDVKIFLLSRNKEKTAGYSDPKTYTLSSVATTPVTYAPADGYKRHLYNATARAVNLAGRK